MRRTQIYFGDQTYGYLKKESETRHVTISEVIRESINDRIKRKVQNMLKATDETLGIWKDREFDVEAHIRNLRKDRTL